MYKQIITITKGAETLPYSSLKKCCELNPEFSYGYIVRFRMPFEYKRWKFNRINFNLPIGKKREGEIIETVDNAEFSINCEDECNMHLVMQGEAEPLPDNELEKLKDNGFGASIAAYDKLKGNGA